jgi:hypothetical protein
LKTGILLDLTEVNVELQAGGGTGNRDSHSFVISAGSNRNFSVKPHALAPETASI